MPAFTPKVRVGQNNNNNQSTDTNPIQIKLKSFVVTFISEQVRHQVLRLNKLADKYTYNDLVADLQAQNSTPPGANTDGYW